ncbi:MAG TPA: hypothetical protein PL151_03000 [Phycisphaerae bacterium]|nr:hypothetical protein [Phycisphaerae bacterium]HOJ72473.1 hypothetical protein [Phycisphaerae bacterium]HOM49865.1 hypothetical protein [Phycisphaerae bacterium]HON67776.1 hypothetical protein [Phycisphaerae bacterium]HOQ84721.1 hypothetical protein [Phycisphaerae bacterium]
MKRTLTIAIVLGGLLAGCPETPPSDPPAENTLVIFHNASGPMCLDALAWLDSIESQHTGLAVKEYLTTVPANVALLNEMMAEYGTSQGVSTTFGYLPIIFYRDQAFSGFDDSVRTALATLLSANE